MYAQVLNEVGQFFAAIEACEKAAKIDPKCSVVYQTLARSQANFGERELAIKSLSRAVHLNPMQSELWSELREFHLKSLKCRSSAPEISAISVN